MSVEWRQPKTNWVATDFVNADDHNRIVDNITVLKALLHDMFPDFGFGTMPHKDYTAWPYASEMNTIENNISALNSHSYELNLGNKKSYRVNGNLPNFEDLNRIENALWTLHEKIIAQQAKNTSPTFQMMSDTSPNWTSNSTYTIFGKLLDNGNGIGGVKLVEKNQTINVNSDGLFSTTVTLSSGSNKFTLKAWDVDHNPRFYTFTKRYDGTLPVITITSPVNTWNTSSSYTVTGNATDSESGISKVTINGSAVTLGSGGSFSKTITLSKTDNIVTIAAYNNAGKVATNSYHAYYDTNPPSIVLTSSTATTTARSYTLSGRALDSESGISGVTVNGSAVSVDANGYFSKNYTLSEGVNTFTAVATDKKGNSSSTSLSVVWVNPATDYGTNVNYNGSHSHQDSANGLSCKYSDDVDNDLNYSVHGSAAAVVNADFYHRYGANYMSLSVNVESGGDTTGSFEWRLMNTAGNVLNSYSSGGVGSGTYGITVNTSAYANRTDVFLRVKVRSEVGGWVSAYSGDGWSATASMTGCTQSV